MNKTKIDLDTWNRREHFEFFSKFKEPYFGITADLDITTLYNQAKQENYSLFLAYLYCTLKAVNQLPAMRMRIQEGEVVIYDTIHVSPTLLRTDGTFSFSYLDFSNQFLDFHSHGKALMNAVDQTQGLNLGDNRDDVIHCSALPWVKFTSLSHARPLDDNDCCPKMSFGKIVTIDGRKIMPVSCHVHHALVDGIDVGRFYELVQSYFDDLSWMGK